MNEETKREIGVLCANIKYLREKNGLSEKEMAKELHISEESLRSIENGDFPLNISCGILFTIMHRFGIHPKYILDEKIEENFSDSGL